MGDGGTYARNVSFALQERLAFSPLVPNASASGQPLQYAVPEPEDASTSHPDLAAARQHLRRLVAQRLRELQLLTDWPLSRPRRTAAQLKRLLEEGGLSVLPAWQALGPHDSPLHSLPELPDLIRRDLFGAIDLLLALAGQGHREHDLSYTAAPQVANAAAAGGAGSGQGAGAAAGMSRGPNTSPFNFPSLLRPGAPGTGSATTTTGLPRSLAGVSLLPALRSLKPPSLEWFRGFFSDLRPQQRHVGVDDRLHPWFREVKVQAARALVQEGSISLCRSFAKFGVPHGVRAPVWEVALGLGPLTSAHEREFDALCEEAQAQQLLCDVATAGDMRLVCDAEQFFLFEEMLRAVMMAFTRDPRVSGHCAVEPQPQVTTAEASTASSSSSSSSTAATAAAAPGQAYPPSGVLLPQGTVLLAAPLCYMHEAPAAVYRMLRAMHCRFWCKLSCLSTHGAPSPSLPLLVRAYEDLLQELDPEVVAHVHKLGIPIAAIALPWIVRAFSGYLPVEEVLLLWDRIIGLDSLLPVSLLAVAVVCFRRQVILTCASSRELLDAMADLSQLKVMPLMQAVLFHA